MPRDLYRHTFKVGDRVSFQSQSRAISESVWAKRTLTGTVYKLLPNRVCVLPDSWAKEGHKSGLRLMHWELSKLETMP